jgi:DeoR/GlpR family transcriptional regulator of sugar metabolism
LRLRNERFAGVLPGQPAAAMKKRYEEEILGYLEKHEFFPSDKAAAHFGVSAATMRRVFARMAKSALGQRVHGGLRRLPEEISSNQIPFVVRGRWLADEKRRLAAKAMEFWPRGGTVFLHCGSTVLGMAHHIRGGTILTNSVNVCNVLMSRFAGGGGPEVVLLGGLLKLKSDILVGSWTEAMLREYRTDVMFFSARGMDEEGVLDTTDEEVAVPRVGIRGAAKRVMLADHSKFRKFGLRRMVSWKDVDVLVTSDHPKNRRWFKMIREHGVEVVFA